MSDASRAANYRARRRDMCVTLMQEVQKLSEEVAQLREAQRVTLLQLNQLLKIFSRLDHVDMGRERDDTVIEQNQRGAMSRPEPHAGARVEDISLTSTDSVVGKKERKKHITTSSPPPGFDAWWAIWPNKVCRKAAIEAFRTAAAKVPVAELMAGVDRYIRSKPADRQWCHPATWLNGERWTDQPAPLPQPRQMEFCVGIG